jgi:glycosyltransferase involved in cell wall biosynthesis
MKEGYIKQSERKKILLLCDDIRLTSGIATMAREIVVGTSHRFNWVNAGAAIKHPEIGKIFDLSEDTNRAAGITDASVKLYPIEGYGSQPMIRQLIEIEKPDALMLFTDPRYFVHIFQMENEIRKKIPLLYLQIWDDFPAPNYNKSFYESCDLLMSISKQSKLIPELVLGEKAKDRVITYVPHGINEKHFFPINEFMVEESKALSEHKKALFGKDLPEYVVLYNARNIRRKCTSDLIAAWALFCDSIGKEKAKKCALLLHTQKQDENGTNLEAVRDLLCDPTYQRVVFSDHILDVKGMNRLYNMADVTALISSNEGWGLSLTESMMAGTMIIANTTGGMQDQMRFEDNDGNWFTPSREIPSNHYGTFKKHGIWARPVFPSNLSLVGSLPTPYIFDDRADFRDIAKAIEEVYNLPKETRVEYGMKGREWVTSKESMMSANNMCNNVISSIETTFSSWKPKENFELIKVNTLPRKKIQHKLVY